MACVMCLHFGKQKENILEHINPKCHLCTLSQLVDHFVTRHTPRYTSKHTHAKIIVSTLEH